MFTDRFREQAEGAAVRDGGPLGRHDAREERRRAGFTGAAKNAAEAEVKRFYQFLADWEQQHLDGAAGAHRHGPRRLLGEERVLAVLERRRLATCGWRRAAASRKPHAASRT
ncbi:MAG: hypothetical protein MZV65_01265 [Chromatiales bacterium]|nr:hypothetical protein [Chromatiales bacterium]